MRHDLFRGLLALGVIGATPLLALPVGLRVEQRANPLGMDVPAPTLSWQSDAKTNDWKQAAYRVEVASSAALLAQGKADVWDSGRVSSGESVGLLYKGPTLAPQKRYFWRVRTWDSTGKEELSREQAWWETGLQGKPWQAAWITADNSAEQALLARVHWLWLPGSDAEHVPNQQVAEFRYVLHLDKMPETATFHCLTGGNFTTRVNGQQTGHKEEWGSFDREDLRGFLKVGAGAAGDNEIVVRATARRSDKPEGTADAVAAVLQMRAAGGRSQDLVSDAGWEARAGESGTWAPAHDLGPLSAIKVNVGSDRREMQPAPDRLSTGVSLLRKDFDAHGGVASARLYITAMGSYRATLNGQRVGDAELAPGFTDFRKRVLYQTYDVTSLVKTGKNTLGLKLGGGWHSSPLLWAGVREFSGPDMVRAQLVLTAKDGTETVVATDTSWSGAADATDSAEIYGGESYDARQAKTGWDLPGYREEGAWKPVKTGSVPAEVAVTAQPDLPVHVSQTLRPVSMKGVSGEGVMPGAQLFDMGQNMVGVVRLRVRGQRGDVVRLQFAERLKPDGSVYTENLRNADAADEYTLRGGGEEEWTPIFTFHGFRYVQVSGLRAGATLDTLQGEVMNSLPDKPAMRFQSSSPLLNSMFELGLWGQRGNFVSVPTDCPQRDERMGWMGDAGVFWRTGSYNFNIDSFTHKFMNDVTDAQSAAGSFMNISPNLLLYGPEAVGAPGWGDAGVLVPYATWMQYGDRRIVDNNWDAMERWMRMIESDNPNWLREKNLGPNYADWLAPDPHTPRELVATAYWALIAQQMETMAKATGRNEAAERYAALYGKVREAYRQAYLQPDGTVKGGTQTAYLLTLYTGMADAEQRRPYTDKLVADIEAHGNHLTTGFLGTPFLLSVLDTEGRSDVAYRLLLNDTYPSWGYMVSKGATTWWERWNGDTGDPGMNSYNHYAFGSVMAWVYRRVSGIDTDAAGPGFHHLVIAPHTDARLTHAHTEYDSPYGTVMTDWTRSANGGLNLTVTAPANTTATLQLPITGGQHATMDGKALEVGSVEVGSGTRHFIVQ